MNRFRSRICCHSALAIFTLASFTGFWIETSYGQEGQPQATASLTREGVDNLLSQARQAIAAGKLDEADALLHRAEASKIRYPVLHFGDTPARVRSDWDKTVARSKDAKPLATKRTKSLNPLAGLTSGKQEPTQDPFAGALRSAAKGESQDAAQAELTEAVPQLTYPNTNAQQIPQQLKNPHALGMNQLRSARRALAVGDVALAKQHVAQAKEFSVDYGVAGDSPVRVLQAIDEFEQLSSNKDDSPSWQQGFAKFLLTQADAMIQHGDWDGAENIANEAAGLQASFESTDTTPQDVLIRVANLRQGKEQTIVHAAPKSISVAKADTLKLLAEARQALSRGNLTQAEKLAAQTSQLNVADSQFAADEDSPARLAADLQRARAEAEQVQLATSELPLELRLPFREQGFVPTPRLAQVPEEAPTPLPQLDATQNVSGTTDPYDLLQQGEQALRAGNRGEALRLFREAHQRRGELDVVSQEQLQGHLQMLSSQSSNRTTRAAGGESLLNSASTGQKLLARQIAMEVGKRQSEAAKLRTTNPYEALELLSEIKEIVSDSELDENTKIQLNRRVELSIGETERYLRDHKSELELDAANREVLEEIDRTREVRVQVQTRMAEMVDQYNTFRDEHRYAEMEIVAKRLYEMAPEEPVAQQLWENAKFIRREMLNTELDQMTEEGVVGIFQNIRQTAAEGLLDSNTPIHYGETWANLVKNRKGSGDLGARRSARELEIQRKLRTPVLPRYDNTPLTEVVEQLSQLTGVNIHLDPRGLGQEGVRSDTPVSLNLGQEVNLESALNLILEPLHLTYMVKDEVLKITSEQIRDGDVYEKVYNVADLVVPIPNFVPSSNIGLQGLINDAYAAIPQNNRSYGGPVAVVPVNAPGQPAPAMGTNVLQQQFGTNAGGTSAPVSGGPGGMGGAANADFDSLIDLIVSTVEHDSWMENGTGEGEIQPFPTNLSLVISQTQRVHEQIADLLEQLRRLQDLQVTIEVRFIRLTDSFFERIGIDFDFNIEDGSGITDLNTIGASFEPSRASATVGVTGGALGLNDPLPDFTVDLDVPFRNSSFNLAQPQFGTPVDVGQFGFAILSDIEAFFLINASQGDRRANVLQAPKVTLFNGQQATVVDSSFRPFVISVIPVVGEFAAAQQPVIVVLSEGTMLTVQAVVSDDRRYVRLTLVPFFSQIGEVNTFTFEGSETSSASANTTDQDDDGNDESNDNANSIVRSGTTVQLPTFQVISIATTVSVPDGGTVLLGGIKRLSEGRTEFGVPLLSKMPYVDRLFRNVGIGRETDSLMMMVTPHIIIQEEEEDRL